MAEPTYTRPLSVDVPRFKQLAKGLVERATEFVSNALKSMSESNDTRGDISIVLHCPYVENVRRFESVVSMLMYASGVWVLRTHHIKISHKKCYAYDIMFHLQRMSDKEYTEQHPIKIDAPRSAIIDEQNASERPTRVLPQESCGHSCVQQSPTGQDAGTAKAV